MSDTISGLVALCGVARESVDLVAKIRKHFPSPTEKELLRAAGQSGEFFILEPDQIVYPIVQAGGTGMGDESDAADLARHYEAFKSLCSNGCIEHAGGGAFRLTVAGFEKAAKLT